MVSIIMAKLRNVAHPSVRVAFTLILAPAYIVAFTLILAPAYIVAFTLTLAPAYIVAFTLILSSPVDSEYPHSLTAVLRVLADCL